MYQPLHLLLNLSIQGKDQLICMLYKPVIYDVQNFRTSQSTDASVNITTKHRADIRIELMLKMMLKMG